MQDFSDKIVLHVSSELDKLYNDETTLHVQHNINYMCIIITMQTPIIQNV